MKTSQRIALLCALALTLVLSGVGAFALQPPTENLISHTNGFWQNQKQDGGTTYTWEVYQCSCGSVLYGIDINHDISFTDIINIAPTSGTGQITYADTGAVAYFTVDDPHESTSHRYGEFYKTQTAEDIIYTSLTKPIASPVALVILVESVGAESYLTDSQFYRNNITGAPAANTIRTYSLVNTLSSIYDIGVYNAGAAYGYGVAREEIYDEAYQAGYADGQVNASENADAFELFDNLFEGVTTGLMPVLSFEVFGFSILGLLSLLVTGFVIMLIVKIIRG